jgi:hypothetical protein
MVLVRWYITVKQNLILCVMLFDLVNGITPTFTLKKNNSLIINKF